MPPNRAAYRFFEKERDHSEGQDNISKTKGTFLKRVEQMQPGGAGSLCPGSPPQKAM